jgi:hypothetical protein
MAIDQISRRDFVEAVGISAGASALLGAPATAAPGSANEKIRTILIGAGSRGNQLLDSFLPQAELLMSTTTMRRRPPSASRKSRRTPRTPPATTGRCSTARMSMP